MFKNVIVGVDGEEGGRDAIALAKLLGAADGVLTLVYVYRSDPYVVWAESSSPYDAAEPERAQDLLDSAKEQAGLEARLRIHGSSSVGCGLHELAEAIGADLIVVGSSRRGSFGRVLIGDDTRASLNGAPCAVAIAPAGYSAQPVLMREIGVGYDGSPESEHAVRFAKQLAHLHGTKLSALQAVYFPSAYAGRVSPDDPTIEGMIDAAREQIAALGGVEPHAALGHPAEELALYSASLDLLVVGSRSYGPIGRLVHGSTAQQLARTARCPLLVLTRAARQVQAPGTSGRKRETAGPGAAR